ncbi:MAG: carbonic anhydrase [Candidatus Wallbacteria bacterium]|nr:carbonic anhydrase [Candidatus Wallbacteria bacterium]
MKPGPDDSLRILKEGNLRFASGNFRNPHRDTLRLAMAGSEEESDHVLATVLSCSDSLVPLEILFDIGVMDVHAIRSFGNICSASEAAAVEYGVKVLKTPLLILLGHTRCGAARLSLNSAQGKSDPLDRNLSLHLKQLRNAADKVVKDFSGLEEEQMLSMIIEANLWRNLEELLLISPAVREAAISESLKIACGIYDVSSGRIDWLASTSTDSALQRASKSSKRQ